MTTAAGTAPCKVVAIDLRVFGQSLTMTTAVPQAPMRLADMVPLAWSVSDQLVRRALLNAQQAGHMPPCHRSCAACCRYAVPLSVPEAFRLLDDVASLPPDRQAGVERTFDAALGRLLQAGPPPEAAAEPARLHAFAQWYASIDTACPFLVRQVCDIYPTRPTACREHMVTSPPDFCRDADPASGALLPLPFSLAHALGMLASELEGTEVESILLPTLLPWSAHNAARSLRRWPGPPMVEHFAAILRRLSAAGGAADTASRATDAA
jgi:Fe-S-cluster containining protein